jgi:hypothetical protein
VYWETDTLGLFYDTGSAWIGPINQSTLGAGAVTTSILADHAVTQIKLATASVGSNEIIDGSITAADISSALSPAGGAGAGTEALRALGTAAGTAAAGTHAAQHSRTGADPLVIATFISSGVIASRPSTGLVAGMIYVATDQNNAQYLYTGSAWIVAGGAPLVTRGLFASGPPGTPNDGDVWIATDSLTNPTFVWTFRFNNGASGTYKWELTGGAPALILIDTQETLSTSGLAADLATVGPQITIGRGGDYEVEWGAVLSDQTGGSFNSSANMQVWNGTSAQLGVRSANTSAQGGDWGVTMRDRFNGLSASTNIRARYVNNITGGVAGYAKYRWLSVLPYRVI